MLLVAGGLIRAAAAPGGVAMTPVVGVGLEVQ
jgi:hypothetical protein